MPSLAAFGEGVAAALAAMCLISKWPLLCLVSKWRLLASCNMTLAALRCIPSLAWVFTEGLVNVLVSATVR